MIKLFDIIYTCMYIYLITLSRRNCVHEQESISIVKWYPSDTVMFTSIKIVTKRVKQSYQASCKTNFHGTNHACPDHEEKVLPFLTGGVYI